MSIALIAPIVVCVLAVCGLLWSDRRGSTAGRTVCKCLASSAFPLLAWNAGAMATTYGRAIMAALTLCWLGDMLLLAPRGRVFLAGIGAFLLGHLLFALAFAGLPLSIPALAVAAVIAILLGACTLRWLRPHLQGPYRIAVPVYVLAILLMCVLAVGASVAQSDPRLAIAALVFAASDIAVARNRFVAPGFLNRAWGLPLYYAAQVAFALSVMWMPVAP